MDRLVIHAVDSDSKPPTCDSWIEYWKEEKHLEEPEICPCCGNKINEIVGAHVFQLIELTNSDKHIYITPTCKDCNDKYKYSRASSHPFSVEDSMLLPI